MSGLMRKFVGRAGMRVLDGGEGRLLRSRAQALGGGARLDDPAGIIERVFAIQSQDVTAAALGLRARGRNLTLGAVAASEERGELVRGWFMRGTLHTVAGRDYRWLTGLFGPVVLKAGARRLRELGLDEALCGRAERVIEDVVGERGTASRAELTGALAKLGVDPSGQAPFHLIRRAALRGRICFGPSRDGEQVFTLLDSLLPAGDGPGWEGDAAVAELARRYLRAHAPASLQDFTTWSGLPAATARRAWKDLESGDETLPCRVLDQDCLLPADRAAELDAPRDAAPDVRLLPMYDGYLLAYRSRELSVPPTAERLVWPGGGQIRATVLADGLAIGTWSRNPDRSVNATLFNPATTPDLSAEKADVLRFLHSA